MVNVARASQEELLLDYEDFIRHRRQMQWLADSQEAMAVRKVAKEKNEHWDRLDDLGRYDLYSHWLNSDDPIVRANTLICLIHQANYLLDLQIDALESQFIEGGGYSEALATKRIEHRNQEKAATNNYPPCPQCGGTLVLRTAKNGPKAGEQFLGCSNYPQCKGTHKF